MWELAGIAGLDPTYRTLREMVWASTAKRRHDWQIASELWAPLANAVRDPRYPAFVPQDINPFGPDGDPKTADGEAPRLTPEDEKALLKAMAR